MVPPESPFPCSLTNELNVQMNGASADLLISHERIGVLGFWSNAMLSLDARELESTLTN